jgi:hypothetical protein
MGSHCPGAADACGNVQHLLAAFFCVDDGISICGPQSLAYSPRYVAGSDNLYKRALDLPDGLANPKMAGSNSSYVITDPLDKIVL